MDYPVIANAADPTIALDPVSGKFSDGNPGTGQPASKDRADDMNQVFDELMGLITAGGGTPLETTFTQVTAAVKALIAMNASTRNGFVDPCCRVAQGLVPNLSTSRQYGAVDMVQAWVSAGSVSAGTIGQDTTGASGSPITLFSVHLAGVSLGANSAISFRKWIESADAHYYIGGAGYIAIRVLHDIGANIATATITVNKANAANNFAGGVTLIQASANLVVNTGASTVLFFPVANFGACGNGIEVILTLPCGAGAIVTKDFYVTDFQIALGTAIAPFELPKFNADQSNVYRYFEKSWDYATPIATISFPGMRTGINPQSLANGSGAEFLDTYYKIEKLAVPTVTLYSEATGATGKIRDVTTGADYASTLAWTSSKGFEPNNGSGGAIAAGDNLRMHWTADARL